MPRVILSGGGTAGHVNPALAIGEIIKEAYPGTELLYVGTPDGIERRLAAEAKIAYEDIRVAGFQRKLTLKNIKRNITAADYLIHSGKRAKEIIESFKPDLVIGTGGYVSEPIVHKAAAMGIRTVIHEQNAFPGVTTKLLSKKADRIMLTVGEAASAFRPRDRQRCVITGLPVRSGFVRDRLTKEEARKRLGLSEKICILSTGGTLGAGRINETVSDLIAWYKESGLKVNHIHSYGKNGRGSFVASLKAKGIELKDYPELIVREFIDDMPTCMEAADLIISRCGAGALTEIQAVGCGSVLIPSPIVAENHQYYNGRVLSDAGAAILIEQKELTSSLLINTVSELINDPARLRELGENASRLYIKDTPERILGVIKEVLG